MAELVERLERRTRTEIRYARGMFCMQRERYLVYCEDLRRAREVGDFARRRALLADLGLFLKEVHYLGEKHRSGYARLVALRRGGFVPSAPPRPAGHAGADDSCASPPAPVVHLASARRDPTLELQ